MIPRDEFLPIPCAPAYEVNGRFIVRNRATSHVIRPLKSGVVAFFYGDCKFQCRPEFYYQQAVAAVEGEEWRPVPSLNGKYELNHRGDLRSSRTKVLLEKLPACSAFAYRVYVNGKRRKIAVDQLMNEVYSTELKPLPRAKSCMGVLLSKGSEQYGFSSIADCAKFLAPRVFYGAMTIATYLSSRPAELCGWSLEYLEPELVAP